MTPLLKFSRFSDTHPSALDAVLCLDQGVALLRNLNDEQFVTTFPPMFRSGLGAHVRHVVDHVDCLLSGLENGVVNYDHRERAVRTERDRVYAIDQLIKRMERLGALKATSRDTALRIHMDTGCGQVQWADSSLTRELQFVISHTIHHYALMAAILVHANLDVPKDFGVSPSTLRHRLAIAPEPIDT
ncbi:MAG: DinB family protein [Pseudomonadota bacterium]